MLCIFIFVWSLGQRGRGATQLCLASLNSLPTSSVSLRCRISTYFLNIFNCCVLVPAIGTLIAHLPTLSEECILEKKALEWPLCECLIACYSPGFPVSKAEEYVRLRKPFCVNNVSSEHILRDRRLVYHVLQRHGIPVPRHAFMIRAGPVEKHSVMEELEDAVIIDGQRIAKPFVEKPVNANVRASVMCVYTFCSSFPRPLCSRHFVELYFRIGFLSSHYFRARSEFHLCFVHLNLLCRRLFLMIVCGELLKV